MASAPGLPAAAGAFLAPLGWGDSRVEPLAADASFRRYYRLRRAGESALLMAAPPSREDVGRYVRVARHLRALGTSAPRVHAADPAAGLALIEDLGEATFTRLLDGGADPAPLYRLAVDLLVHLQTHPRAGDLDLPPYDRATLVGEADLLCAWYWPDALGAPCPPGAAAAYREAWGEALAALPGMPVTLVLRDFHVDNLMRLEGRAGLAACGVLDFQDALLGHPAYDLVSLLEDARRDLPPELVAEMRARYQAARPDLDPAALDTACALLGAQRHCKVAGIFVRLDRRDGKPGYRRHLPRVLGLLAGHLGEPALAPVRAWLEAHLPHLAR